MSGEKHAIRQYLRAQRRALREDTVRAAGAAVRSLLQGFPPYAAATAVIAYVAAENEIPTSTLISDIAESQRALYLPRDNGGGVLVRWRSGDRLVSGPGGTMQPADGAPEIPISPALVLVPVVAWDQTGTRLGRGGGFYDRLFAKLDPGIVRVGLAYEFQQIEDLPRDPWDVPLHYVITERQVVQCGCGDGTREEPLQKGGLQL